MSTAGTLPSAIRTARVLIGSVLVLGVLTALYARATYVPSPRWTHFTMPVWMFAIGLDRLLFPLATDTPRMRRWLPLFFFTLAALGVLLELI